MMEIHRFKVTRPKNDCFQVRERTTSIDAKCKPEYKLIGEWKENDIIDLSVRIDETRMLYVNPNENIQKLV